MSYGPLLLVWFVGFLITVGVLTWFWPQIDYTGSWLAAFFWPVLLFGVTVWGVLKLLTLGFVWILRNINGTVKEA